MPPANAAGRMNTIGSAKLLQSAPEHEVGQLASACLQLHKHSHGVAAQPKEDPMPQAQHPGVTPNEIQCQGQDGKCKELSQQSKAEVGNYQGCYEQQG